MPTRYGPPRLVWGLILVGAGFAGCVGPAKNVTRFGKDYDVARKVQDLAALEQENDYGLFEFIYSTKPEKDSMLIQASRGLLLVNDEGAFKYEQQRRQANEAFWVHYEPNGSLVVAFPLLKRMYRAPASILEDPELTPVLAGYDGLRLLLGLSDVWSNPAGNALETSERTGSVTFQQPGRPYQWKVLLTEGLSFYPFSEMRAHSGARTQTKIFRRDVSYKEYDEDATRRVMGGKEAGGQPVTSNVWEITLAQGLRVGQIQYTPYPKGSMDPDKAREQIKFPTLESELEEKELTVAQIKRWLNLR